MSTTTEQTITISRDVLAEASFYMSQDALYGERWWEAPKAAQDRAYRAADFIAAWARSEDRPAWSEL